MTLATLESAGRAETVSGQQALILARRVASPHETGAAVASMSRQLLIVMEDALAGAEPDADVIDAIFKSA